MKKENVINLKLIKEKRLEKDISIEDMSLKLGYEGYQAYYYKERGIRNMSVEDVAKISVVLGIPINMIFFKNKITNSETTSVV